MMDLPENSGPSHWLAYFGSDDLDATVAKIGELGGQVVVEPTPVPTGRFAVAADPQGAFFAVFQGDFDD
jgi:predicted enzyme related to lactoylglutathione lyase